MPSYNTYAKMVLPACCRYRPHFWGWAPGRAGDVEARGGGREAGLVQIVGSLHVANAEGLPIRLRADSRWGMKDRIAASRSALERAGIGEITLDDVRVELLQPPCVIRATHERTNGVAALDQSLHEVRSALYRGTGHLRP